jgi:hypothetical protein
METESGEGVAEAEEEKATDRPLPGMPGAAATLEVAARALRNTPLASWRDVIGTFNPDAPTREEAIQTILGVAKLLSQAAPDEAKPSSPVDVDAAEVSREEAHGQAPAAEPAPSPTAEEEGGGKGTEGTEFSFDYAAGFDEGYQMGRKVGLALGTKGRPGPPR